MLAHQLIACTTTDRMSLVTNTSVILRHDIAQLEETSIRTMDPKRRSWGLVSRPYMEIPPKCEE
jgi:hypothetical protein